MNCLFYFSLLLLATAIKINGSEDQAFIEQATLTDTAHIDLVQNNWANVRRKRHNVDDQVVIKTMNVHPLFDVDKPTPKPIHVVADSESDSFKPVAIMTEEVKSPKIIIQNVKSTTVSKLNSDKQSSDHKKEKPKIEPRILLDDDTNDPNTIQNEENIIPSRVLSHQKATEAANNSIYFSGNIHLNSYVSSMLDSVQYDLNRTTPINGTRSTTKPRLSFTENHISNDSQVILYVSTSETFNRSLASAQFRIKIKHNHFPHPFFIQYKLPKQMRDDITLYFFAYVTQTDKRVDMFVPASTTRVSLQGTTELSQKIDVFVKATGTELNGQFNARFNRRSIPPDTYFEVSVIPEHSRPNLHNHTTDIVAQLTIKNLPSAYPVDFSLLVFDHLFDSDKRYYAIAHIVENGVRRLLNQEPILIYETNKQLVTSELKFYVIPSSTTLDGTIVRSRSDPFNLQPRSSLVLSFADEDSNKHNVTVKLTGTTLPLSFHVDLSQITGLDPSRNYNVSAQIIDGQKTAYLGSANSITIIDNISNVTIPVDDILFYVHMTLRPSLTEQLSYIPGAAAQIYVSEGLDAFSKPISDIRIDPIPEYFREYTFTIPVTSIQRDRDYYLVMTFDVDGRIIYVSRSLLISNSERPPLQFQLPTSINTLRGVIYDVDNRPAQWSSSSYATLILTDDTEDTSDPVAVQYWNIRLDKDFPIHFEIKLDVSLLRLNRIYRLRAAIRNAWHAIEYEPAGGVLALSAYEGIINSVQIPVRNSRRFHRVDGVISMKRVTGPLPPKSELILRVSSTSSLTFPNIIHEARFPVEGRYLPLNFTMDVPLIDMNMNSVHYILAEYIVNGNVVVPANELFEFWPRQDKPIVFTIRKHVQIPITGQVTSNKGPLVLPSGSSLHLFITNNSSPNQSNILSQADVRPLSNGISNFQFDINYKFVEKRLPLYLHTDIIYNGKVIISMPKATPFHVTEDSEWNLNLMIDLPTLLFVRVAPVKEHRIGDNEYDIHIEILQYNTTNVVARRLQRCYGDLPQEFYVELDDKLFEKHSKLQARAMIKNIYGKTLFDTGNVVGIHKGVNVNVDLAVILNEERKATPSGSGINDKSLFRGGKWSLVLNGINSNTGVNARSVSGRTLFNGR